MIGDDNMETLKATQKDLNSVIHWSSSRWNSKKKADVVKEIIFLVEVGEDVRVEYGTGSYSERGHLGGWEYILDIKDGEATLTERKVKTTVYKIEMPKKNRFYTSAQKFKVIKKKYDWHDEILNKEFEVDKEDEDSYYFQVNLKDEGFKQMAINKKLVEVIK